ncbi:hypothetical protein B0H15DRAFT_932962 [Mycena belliarum]|uniref:Uncharacterized protein n=1 Tax=Mycena belliarum TaxID=1033014 RepID=A0AAD6U1B5_9AGAR|nr:hypothetical protein B0H15DRAFT_932962 [Mycena belliae]
MSASVVQDLSGRLGTESKTTGDDLLNNPRPHAAERSRQTAGGSPSKTSGDHLLGKTSRGNALKTRETAGGARPRPLGIKTSRAIKADHGRSPSKTSEDHSLDKTSRRSALKTAEGARPRPLGIICWARPHAQTRSRQTAGGARSRPLGIICWARPHAETRSRQTAGGARPRPLGILHWTRPRVGARSRPLGDPASTRAPKTLGKRLVTFVLAFSFMSSLLRVFRDRPHVLCSGLYQWSAAPCKRVERGGGRERRSHGEVDLFGRRVEACHPISWERVRASAPSSCFLAADPRLSARAFGFTTCARQLNAR